jgi:hypothetical protein
MFKEIQQGFAKFFTKERVLILILFIILAWALFYYSGSKSLAFDGMDGGFPSTAATNAPPMATAAPAMAASSGVSSTGGYALQPVANPSELLPVDQNSQWSALNPNTMNQGMPDLLQAGYHIGLDTIGQTLRNPNLQLRSDPLIPKSEVGPWNQSTIEADVGRVPLEIGQGTK